MDGNFSAKRLDGSGSADMRVFNSDYFIPREKVDRFKDSVQSKSRNVTGSRASTCSDNWVAAKAVQEDQVQVFQQMGIFVLACRHGFVECIAEMRRSGELAKYALGIVEQVLDVCGPDQAIGHDIGCSSRKTILSSLLGQRAKDLNLQVVVNAFHGFVHNRVCQLQNHPLYLAGLGIEDLETCERIFANSNSTAALICHASLFHWMQFLDLHFDQWDSDKYLELSQFLFNNYKQALGIIWKYEPELKDFQLTHGISDEDIVSWHHEELEYLQNCSEELDSVTLAVKYVEVLEKLHFAEATYASVTQVPFLTYTPADFQARGGLRSSAQAGTTAINAEYASALRRYELRLNEVANFKRSHNITKRWTRDHPQYNEALEYVRQRTFIRAVEELEGLVVQRLAELSKANLAGTGYKMRKHLSKAITRRSATIRTALERYNKLAPRQCPPRPKLDYADVIGYSTFGEFELLKYSRYNILEKPWMKPLNREMSMKFFRLAWVDSDDDKLQTAVSTFEANGMDNKAAEMREWYLYRHRINDIHRSRLSKIYGLTGYTGVVPSCVKDPMGNQDHNDEELDEVASDEVLRLGDTLEHMNADSANDSVPFLFPVPLTSTPSTSICQQAFSPGDSDSDFSYLADTSYALHSDDDPGSLTMNTDSEREVSDDMTLHLLSSDITLRGPEGVNEKNPTTVATNTRPKGYVDDSFTPSTVLHMPTFKESTAGRRAVNKGHPVSWANSVASTTDQNSNNSSTLASATRPSGFTEAVERSPVKGMNTNSKGRSDDSFARAAAPRAPIF
ncbi:hypothetical protein EDD15DRAFT_2373911 [Pisolithus albus]|nr:hypothetical protein EDD15DRAFT_2373911 [Pisolithus albus]